MSDSFVIKLITESTYHLWNDALHARALAYQTHNDWNRGIYIRWAVITSWTVLEQCCADALNENKIGYRFRENIDKAIDKNGFAKINWTEGIWNSISQLQVLRNDYIHRKIAQEKLWPKVEIADLAIVTVRNAVKDIYLVSNNPVPIWVDDDDDTGWVNT